MKRIKKSRDQDEPLKMNITENSERNTGLLLSGGGAKSIFQAQVLKRLKKAGYSFDIISGVSAGSLNAAIASQNKDDLVKLWLEVGKHDLFTGGLSLWRLLKITLGWAQGVYENNGLEEFIRESYDPSNTEIPFIIGSVNLYTAEYNEFEVPPGDKVTSWRKEEIYKAIIASSSIPLLFPPVEELGTGKGELFAEGGLRNIVPLSSLIDRGVDEIIIITSSPRHLGTTSGTLNTAFEIAERSFDILLNEVLREDIDSLLKVNRIIEEREEDTITVDEKEYRHIDVALIEPRFGLGGMLDFSQDIQKKRIEEANNICDRILEN